MSTAVRVPKSALPLLGWCEKFEPETGDRLGTPCFESYAEMVVFAASLGCARWTKGMSLETREFLDKPYPIDMEYFRPFETQLLLIQLAVDGSYKQLKDEGRLAKIVEGLADLGFTEMADWLSKTEKVLFHVVLAKKLQEYAKVV